MLHVARQGHDGYHTHEGFVSLRMVSLQAAARGARDARMAWSISSRACSGVQVADHERAGGTGSKQQSWGHLRPAGLQNGAGRRSQVGAWGNIGLFATEGGGVLQDCAQLCADRRLRRMHIAGAEARCGAGAAY
jgi:IS5 family transposase